MEYSTEERAVNLGYYLVETKETVRAAAAHFGVSKSTVHKDVTERLLTLAPALHREVAVILAQNKAERHLRGGKATKEKYEALRKTKQS